MSWRIGAKMWWKIWPIIKEHMPDESDRQDFSKTLLTVFLDWDVDPCDISPADPEVDKIMSEIENQ